MDKAVDFARSLLQDLERFQHLKRERWEQIEESIQMSNRPGEPTEDWIIPPDEDVVRHALEEDRDYVLLKASILEKIPLVKKSAKEAGFNTHHELDWIKFTDPLIGTAALEDAIQCLKRLGA